MLAVYDRDRKLAAIAIAQAISDLGYARADPKPRHTPQASARPLLLTTSYGLKDCETPINCDLIIFK